MTKEHKDFIVKKRVEILGELREYLRNAGHPMTAEQVVAEIYNDDNDDEFEDYVVMLAGDSFDMEIAQEIAMELFNYFPRKTLDGKSFAERMPFDELKKMEKAFQDFKNGTATSGYGYVLPGYE